MDELILSAERRTVIGKQVKRLRREGRVPGIVYGPAVAQTVPVTVDTREFNRFFQNNGHSTLFKLRWSEGEETVFIHEVQIHPVKRTSVHVDFFAPNLRVDLTASVPVVFHHANPDAAGVLSYVRSEIEVRGLPTNIPHQIDADISGLAAVGDALHVRDIQMPQGIAAITPDDELLAHLVAEAVQEEVVAEEEADEATEAAAAEGTGSSAAGGEAEE